MNNSNDIPPRERVRSIQRSLILGTIVLLFLITANATGASPNVILVMADDLGIGDVSPTNLHCRIKTPNLQKLADEGLTFLDAHTPSSVCTPTRCGLLTGRYNWRSRLARGVLSGTSSHLIPADRPTLGHLMRKAGYHTGMIGKWHLGWNWHKRGKEIDSTKPVKNGPNNNRFDYYYGHCGSLDMPPYVWVDTGRITAQPDRVEGVTKGQDRYGWYRPTIPIANSPRAPGESTMWERGTVRQNSEGYASIRPRYSASMPRLATFTMAAQKA